MTKYDIAANAEIAEIAGKRVRLTASQQRSIFGAYVFGRQTINVSTDGQGEVVATIAVLFDSVYARWTLEEVAAAANEGRKLRVS